MLTQRKRGTTMEKKLRQVTDSVHGTIYLSDLESQLIATPFFYRLHDVYQSSTVYMTFPSNRTKRYEHSLGTMELASQLFFSAIANAQVSVRKDIMDGLSASLSLIIEKISSDDFNDVKYCDNDSVKDSMVAIFENKSEEQIFDSINTAMSNNALVDSALEHFVMCFFEDSMKMEELPVKYIFLYQCALQAVRLAALFHDVGHPPYSHIIEDVLDELYSDCINDDRKTTPKFDQKKRSKYLRSLEIFKLSEGRTNLALKNRQLTSFLPIDENYEDKNVKCHLHEQIGIGMFEWSIESVFPKLLVQTSKRFLAPKDEETLVGLSLYYITTIEFTLAILLEKNQLFVTLHRIIDGPFDADRLDYVVRDSKNSGVDWGVIPYKRVIESAKFVHVDPNDKETPIVIAYPEKNADDIEDTLITRYKIFSRINYHHGSIKTATLLQQAVKKLALDYLSMPSDCLSDDINNLWSALGQSMRSPELKIIQWNDSWLITLLYKVIVDLSNQSIFKKYISNKKRNEKDVKRIKNLLEEILLNQKHYTSILKRRNDTLAFMKEILDLADIENDISLLIDKEHLKFLSNTGEEQLKARESLLRLEVLRDARKRGEFALLNTILPTSVIEILKRTLNEEVNNNRIYDFYVIENKGRDKRGLPNKSQEDQNIYLYDYLGEIKPYDRYELLEQQIDVLSLSCLEFHIYVEFTSDEYSIKSLRTVLAKAIAKDLKDSFYELFPHI